MVELLKTSLGITISINGYVCKHPHTQSYNEHKTQYGFFGFGSNVSSEIKTNRRYFYDPCVVFMTEERNTRFGLRLKQRNLLHRSNSTDNSGFGLYKAASVGYGSVCEEEKMVVRRGADFDVSSLKQAGDNSVVREDLDFESGGANDHSLVSIGTFTVNENKLHFLEERDEEVLSKRILGLSRSNKVRSALELYRSMIFSGLRPKLHACNSLLSCLLRNEMLDYALIIFEFMKVSKTCTGHTYSLILKAIANTRGADAAINMFEELEEIGDVKKDFDSVVYNTMISVCAKVNNWVQTESIWRSMRNNECIGTTVTYRLLICTFVRCGQSELALDAYNEMARNGLKPGRDEMQAIIGACAKESKWDMGLSIFQNMLNTGINPNVITCNALVNSLGKAGKVRIAFRVYELMKSFGHAPDAYTWNALIGAFYRANRYGDALRLFESIKKEQSSDLNVELYNTSLMSCQRLGLWDRAVKLLWEMEASGMPVSTVSYNLVIGACEVARKPKVALQVYEHMVHLKCTPDNFTLLSLIRGCIWGSLWDEVEEILTRVAPDASLYNAAIQGMCLRGKTTSAKAIYMKLRENGLKADGKTRALMLQSLPKGSVKQRRR